MAGEVVGAVARADVFCGLCRREVTAEGTCIGCGEVPRVTLELQPAWALAPGAQLASDDGALLEVASVSVTESADGSVGMRARKAVIALKSFGPSPAGPIKVGARSLFFVLREVG